MVSPLKEICAEFFRYTEDGQILPSNDCDKKEAAQTTIEHLGLNLDKLNRLRKSAIEGILEDFEINNQTNFRLLQDDITSLINGFSQPNNQEKYEEFCSTIIYILNQYLSLMN